MINDLLKYVRRFLFGAEPVTSRLSADEAIGLARAGAGVANTDSLNMASVQDRKGQKVWIVSEAAIGSVQVVEVDDATGTILSKYRTGIR